MSTLATLTERLLLTRRIAGTKIATEEAGAMLNASLAALRAMHGSRHVAELCDALAQDYTDAVLREDV
jgi:hypothetical protein